MKTKMLGITIVGALLAAAGLYLVTQLEAPQGILKTLPYLLIGVGCGAFGYGMGEFFSQLTAEKNPELAKQIEIDTKDERNVMIGNMAKAKGYDMYTYVFAALLLAYALMGASFSILIPMVIAYLFTQFYTVYRRIKLDKAL